jgi:hypothetical protein
VCAVGAGPSVGPASLRHAAGVVSYFFQQRDWYLPVEKILIMDEYSTPGLGQILAAATWAG